MSSSLTAAISPLTALLPVAARPSPGGVVYARETQRRSAAGPAAEGSKERSEPGMRAELRRLLKARGPRHAQEASDGSEPARPDWDAWSARSGDPCCRGELALVV
jgi:hypothetical protein